MSQIPKLRVVAGFPAFSNTAIDKLESAERHLRKHKQSSEFTSMTTRPINLELVTDKSTDTFLMAFQRFALLRVQIAEHTLLGHNITWKT